MELRIGIKHSSREISFETDETADEVEKSLKLAMESGLAIMKWLDNRGRIYLIPSDSLAYIEIGADDGRRVGFIA